MWKAALISLVCLFQSAPARAINQLLVVTGNSLARQDYFLSSGHHDMNDDGLPELCLMLGYYPAPRPLEVRNVAGALLWTYTPNSSDFCPTCIPSRWQWDLIGFAVGSHDVGTPEGSFTQDLSPL